MKTAEEIENGLAHCYGSMTNYRYTGGLVITEGIKYLADSADCYWFLDIIASYQPEAMRDPMLAEIQFWTLKVVDGEGVVTCDRDKDDVAITQEIPFTDFPLDEIRVYVTNGMIRLPSEN